MPDAQFYALNVTLLGLGCYDPANKACNLAKYGSSTSFDICDANSHGISVCDNRGNLLELNAYNQMLNGTISTWIGQLSYLTSLDLAANPGISGTYPTELARLSGLTHLGLVGVQCTGTLVQLNASFSIGGCQIQFDSCADYLASPNCFDVLSLCICTTVSEVDCAVPTTATVVTNSTATPAKMSSAMPVLPVGGIVGIVLSLLALTGVVVVFIVWRRTRKGDVVSKLKSPQAAPGELH